MSIGLLTRGYITPTVLVAASDDDETPFTPITAPFEPGDAEYVDHVEEMLSRLVYQLAVVP